MQLLTLLLIASQNSILSETRCLSWSKGRQNILANVVQIDPRQTGLHTDKPDQVVSRTSHPHPHHITPSLVDLRLPTTVTDAKVKAPETKTRKPFPIN